MTEYIVKLRFWLCAYDSKVFSAATDAEAFHLGRDAAHHMMEAASHPEEIDLEERREGLISYIDRLDGERGELAEGIVLDGDRPLHPEARRLIARLAAMSSEIGPGHARLLLKDLIDEARAIPTDNAGFAFDRPAAARPWSVDQVFEYRGDPDGFKVSVVHESSFTHPLDPRLDLRNHRPTGFAWGYCGSGPAQLALAILCHALNCDARAEELYQEFKDDVIARLAQRRSWHLDTRQIFDWILRHPSAVADNG